MKKIILVMIIVIIIVSGIFVVKNKKSNKFEYEIEDISKYNYYLYRENENFGVIDKDGNVIIEANYSNVVIPNPEKDIFICYNNEDSKVLNSNGKELFDEYDSVKEIKLKNVASDLTYEKKVLMYKKDELYGLINFDGKIITKPIYNSIENLRPTEGKFIVSKDGKYGCIDLNGNVLVETEYDKIESDEYYTQEEGYKKSGFIVANKNEDGYKYGYISFDSRKILNTEYNQINRAEKVGEDVYLIVSKDGQYGVFKGDKEVIPNSYQNITYDDKMDLFIIQKNRKYGVANIQGEFIIDIDFDEIEIKGKYLYVSKNENTEIYDSNGKLTNMDPNRSIYETENENYNISTFLNNNITYYGIVDKDGKPLVDETYRYIEYAYENYFIATNDEGNLGIIDYNGNVVLDMKYKSLQKIKGKKIIQGVNGDTNLTEFYNEKIQKTLEVMSPSIQVQKDYIIVSNDEQTIYLDISGNKIQDTSNIGDAILPESIGEYKKVQLTIDSVYYTKSV